MEQWKDIDGFEGVYQVSNYGRVKSLDRIVEHVGKKSMMWKQFKKGRIIKPVKDDKGYLMIRLHTDKKYCIRIHKLVAETFIQRIEGKSEVNHKDGNKENCHVDNLEWCTRLENIQHAHKTGLMTKLPPKAVQMLDKEGNLLKEFYSIHEAKRETGADPTNIVKVCKGERKTHKGYQWRYV